MQTWQRAVTLSRTGVLLRPGVEDGDVLRVRLPRETPRPVPGRGYLVDAGGLAQIQTAFLPATADRADSGRADGGGTDTLATVLAIPTAFLGGSR